MSTKPGSIQPVSTLFACWNTQTLLLDQALHDFFSPVQLASAQRRTHAPVTKAAVVARKQIGCGNAGVSVFVRPSLAGAVIEVGTARQAKFA